MIFGAQLDTDYDTEYRIVDTEYQFWWTPIWTDLDTNLDTYFILQIGFGLFWLILFMLVLTTSSQN